jgi:two-component system LytT family sensor kinase
LVHLQASTTNRWLHRILLAILFWTAAGFLFAIPGLKHGADGRISLLASMAQWWAWGITAPVILYFDRWLPFSVHKLAKRIAAHLIPSLVLTTAYMFVWAGMRTLLNLGTWTATINLLLAAMRGMFLWSWLVYWLILSAWQIIRYYRHYAASELQMERLERRFSEARLNALRMQLDPHFLFNTLNTISSQVERDPKLARRMIGHLGDLMRLSLETRDRQEVALAEEIAFLEHYLSIQKIRFGDHLRVELDVSPDVRFAAVPSLILQPLVENAIRHGISQRVSGGRVRVAASCKEGKLEIRIADDGVGLPPDWTLETSSGLGLSVTAERIAATGRNGHSRFSVSPRTGGGALVEISLPMRPIGTDL